MNSLGLDERLRQSVAHLKIHRRITSLGYQQWMGVSRRTATRDLQTLVGKGVLRMKGKGRGVFYVISEHPPTSAPEMRQSRGSPFRRDHDALAAKIETLIIKTQRLRTARLKLTGRQPEWPEPTRSTAGLDQPDRLRRRGRWAALFFPALGSF